MCLVNENFRIRVCFINCCVPKQTSVELKLDYYHDLLSHLQLQMTENLTQMTLQGGNLLVHKIGKTGNWISFRHSWIQGLKGVIRTWSLGLVFFPSGFGHYSQTSSNLLNARWPLHLQFPTTTDSSSAKQKKDLQSWVRSGLLFNYSWIWACPLLEPWQHPTQRCHITSQPCSIYFLLLCAPP